MKLGVLTVPLYGMNLKDTMKYLSGLGVQSLELGCGGSPGKTHLDPDVYLNDDAKIEELKGCLLYTSLDTHRSCNPGFRKLLTISRFLDSGWINSGCSSMCCISRS